MKRVARLETEPESKARAKTSVSMRHITVPGNWDATRHGIALGESGDPKSPHWKDQLENWKSGETQIFPFSKAAVEKAATEVILLKP